MPKLLQIRNVPERLHRLAKTRAAMCGMSLSDYLLSELKKSLEQPTFEEVLAQLPKFAGELKPSASQILREERARR